MDADTSRKYYLTAAPQCPFPDAADNPMLNGTVSFDAVFVQFYNNYCGVQSYVSNATTQNNFNFDVWDNWAKTQSKNADVKVLLGVPAGPSAAGSGYTPVEQLKPVIEYCQSFSSFGGVMMWDMSQAYANSGFLSGVKSALTSASTRRRMIRGVRWRRQAERVL
jgi:chitinase